MHTPYYERSTESKNVSRFCCENQSLQFLLFPARIERSQLASIMRRWVRSLHVERRIAELGHALPPVAVPKGNFV